MSQTHWDAIYATKTPDQLSWTQDSPATSLRFLREGGLPAGARVLDAGAGLGTLAEALLRETDWQITLADLSPEALAKARARLGDSPRLTFLQGDVRTLPLAAGSLDAWHDRAVLHFLREPADRAAYAATVARALRPGGVAVLAGFAPDGPEKCSGLEVCRADAADLAATLGEAFTLEASDREVHLTPWGKEQAFVYTRFRRR
ncbi:MAG TPA: class I SAM-dependent methyltransferase [Holophagaceae bacterium]|nr:class I SAM-dependent methyltransferase [Holophagaceae bacterium]